MTGGSAVFKGLVSAKNIGLLYFRQGKRIVLMFFIVLNPDHII